jgi:hypothetical protein
MWAAKDGHPQCGGTEINEGSANPGDTRAVAKKLRYMSKIVAIFFGAGNTQLSCTQPIGNLLMSRV